MLYSSSAFLSLTGMNKKNYSLFPFFSFSLSTIYFSFSFKVLFCHIFLPYFHFFFNKIFHFFFFPLLIILFSFVVSIYFPFLFLLDVYEQKKKKTKHSHFPFFSLTIFSMIHSSIFLLISTLFFLFFLPFEVSGSLFLLHFHISFFVLFLFLWWFKVYVLVMAPYVTIFVVKL